MLSMWTKSYGVTIASTFSQYDFVSQHFTNYNLYILVNFAFGHFLECKGLQYVI